MSIDFNAGATSNRVGERASFARRLGPSMDPARAETAGRLLWIAAQGELHRHRMAANAWLGSASNQVQSWQAYASRLENRLGTGPLAAQEITELVGAAPSSPGIFQELTSTLQENDPAFFTESILNLAHRHLHNANHALLVRELLTLATQQPATRARAEYALQVLSGGGGFVAQVEYQAPHLVGSLGSPLMLASFGLAGLAARGASLGILARSTRYGLPTLLASEGAALAVEVPTLVLSRRIGAQIFLGGEDLFSPQNIGQEWLATLGPFALLRAGGNVFNLATPAARQLPGFRTAGGELSRAGQVVLSGSRFGTEVLSFMAGNSLNGYLGLGDKPYSASQNFWNSLLAVGHMRLAGNIVERSGLFHLPQALESQRGLLVQQRLDALLTQAQLPASHPLRGRALAELSAGLHRGELNHLNVERWIGQSERGQTGRVSAALEARGLPMLARWFEQLPTSRSPENFSLGEVGLRLHPATAGGRASWDAAKLPEPLFNMGDNTGGSGSGEGPPGSGSGSGAGPGKRSEPTRSALALELLRQKLDEIQTADQGWRNLLSKTAGGLKSVLDRLTERQDLTKDETFARRISQIDLELAQAKEKETAFVALLESMKVLLRRAPEDVANSEEAKQTEADIVNQQEERANYGKTMRLAVGLLRVIKERGWDEQRRQKYDEIVARLNAVWTGVSSHIPGTEPWRHSRATQAQQTDRRQGVALGLASRPEHGLVDSPVAKEMRGQEDGGKSDELELAYLHHVILEFSRANPKAGNFPSTVERLASEYQAGAESSAAMKLLGEALHHLAYRETSPQDLITHLEAHQSAPQLRDFFMMMNALKEADAQVGEGLEQLGFEPNAADYFSTGLYSLLRSNGDPHQVSDWIQAAQAGNIQGFHPSIALSLYGAAYGRSNLPAELLVEGNLQEAILKRMFSED